nr:MAG: p-loop containing NTP hydrolase [Lokiarchaeota virus Ratatoskr Meg22_1012]
MSKKQKIDRVRQLISEGKVRLIAVEQSFAHAKTEGTDNTHDTFIFGSISFCTCRGFMYRGNCNHVKALRNIVNVQEVTKIPKLATLCPNLNAFFEGGLPLGDLILICGLAAVNKTLLALDLTLCYQAQYPDKNALLILTEERMENTLNVLLDNYSKKYHLNIKRAEWFIEGDEKYGKQGTKQENVVKKFIIKRNELKPDIGDETGYLITGYIPNLYDIMTLIGRPGVFTTPDTKDEKGYQRWIDLPGEVYHVQKTLLAQFIERYNIGWIVTDSITFPVKTEWVLAQSNYPSRNQLYGRWLGRYMHICSHYGITMINIAHGVPPSAMSFTSSGEEKAWGGQNVLHSHKYVIRLKRMTKKLDGIDVPNYNNKRRVYMDRWGTKEANKLDSSGKPIYAVIEVRDDGFFDVGSSIPKKTESKKAEVKKPAKKKKMKKLKMKR